MKYRIKIRNICIDIEYLLIIIITIIFVSNKIRGYMSLYFMCYLFVLFHELAHILLGSFLGKNLQNVTLYVAGVSAQFKKSYKEYLETEEKNKIKNCIKDIAISLAGPISNVVLALLFRKIRFIFEINISLAIINLVPIKPLDGYNILKNIITIILYKKKKDNIEKAITKINIIIVVIGIILCCYLIIKMKCYSILIFCIYIFVINKTSV